MLTLTGISSIPRHSAMHNFTITSNFAMRSLSQFLLFDSILFDYPVRTQNTFALNKHQTLHRCYPYTFSIIMSPHSN